MQRVAKRQHDGAGGERDVCGQCAYIGHPDPGVEDLPRVAKGGHAQWHVAEPQRRETRRLGALREVDLPVHLRRVARERLDGKENPQRQPTGREHARVAGIGQARGGHGGEERRSGLLSRIHGLTVAGRPR
jgi:hypothetical protein